MSELGRITPETSEIVGNRLLDFIEGTEFNTPPYEAVSDYLHLQQLEQSLTLEQENARSNEDKSPGEMHWESERRMTEQEIAFHRTQIYHNQSRVKGYDSAYTHAEISFEHDLADAARREAEAMFAENGEQRSYYVRGVQTKYLEKAQDIINGKRG